MAVQTLADIFNMSWLY